MYLSRLTVRRAPDVAALGALIDPADDGARMDAHHRLIWSAFAGDPGARRDFLWRDMGRGGFLVLSPRPPGTSALFEAPEVQDFAPSLASGDRLSFLLRANATRTVTEADGRKRHRDVVMEALRPVPKGARAEARTELAQAAGRRWLEGQGERAGFAVREARVDAYRVVVPPGKGARRPRFGVIDLEGEVEVADPAAFLARLVQGFGRAKAFGCGLMLIRRA
jgi:CRISPR system Cascade subunit CasE